MKDEKEILITGCIIGGLVGVCAFMIGRWLYKEEASTEKQDQVEIPRQKPIDTYAPMRVVKSPKIKYKKPVPSVTAKNEETPEAEETPIETRAEPQSEKPAVEAKATPLVISDDSFPLKLGSKGKNVERLQVWLMRNFGHIGKVNDLFDDRILSIVKRNLRGADTVSETFFKKYRMHKPVHQQGLYKTGV